MSKPYSITAFGTRYPSIRAAAAAFNLPESTLRHRFSRGWDVEVALIAPVNCGCRLEFVGLDNHSRYRIFGSPDPYTDNVNAVNFFRPDLLDAYLDAHPNPHYRPYLKEGNCS